MNKIFCRLHAFDSIKYLALIKDDQCRQTRDFISSSHGWKFLCVDSKHMYIVPHFIPYSLKFFLNKFTRSYKGKTVYQFLVVHCTFILHIHIAPQYLAWKLTSIGLSLYASSMVSKFRNFFTVAFNSVDESSRRLLFSLSFNLFCLDRRSEYSLWFVTISVARNPQSERWLSRTSRWNAFAGKTAQIIVSKVTQDFIIEILKAGRRH
jgi:hypothetical protein